ncbi:hypothetical protein SRS16CHR_03150 [Variovorax sp. SRS16]|uniref:hypothetical protein n=1 Tax=Variovorax sp. SRS16 TaxID=282217 RepID=UPI0013181082|nr:hypothetical protein [Variovorax sp. SRS16]VTU22930.1 hypothetical protein SRS16CHR_03150 [Variovorax sp. SRS16]
MSSNRYPIIYVRGYAMTASERDETAADPFCGFNVGSTVYRATVDKNAAAQKFVFESPVVRLLSEYGYQNVYQNGLDILDPDWKTPPDDTGRDVDGIASTSIVIYRYYDAGSALLGDGQARDVKTYATGLGQLILRVRDLVSQHPGAGLTKDEFRCYLVAHSMGGLVVRAFLQNHALGTPEARASVDKVFTFATPHNGIDVAGINVPTWLSASEMNTFNRDKMADYLDTPAAADGRVDCLPAGIQPSPERFFCMIGSNRGDYEVAQGLSRMFAGQGSDGLVRIDNAALWYKDDAGKLKPTARAFTYRSHSGFFGIVNSEEAYQNLVRFLFGDVRVDLWFDVDQVALPPDIPKDADVDALYQVELLAAPRGKRWYLSRRVAEEDSPACRTHKELTDAANPGNKSIYLSTVFLANRAKVDPNRRTLAYAMTLGVRVPDYQVNKKFWLDGHYEGSSLYRDTLIIEMEPPPEGSTSHQWNVKYGWQTDTAGQASLPISYQQVIDGKLEFVVPLSQQGAALSTPGITGRVRLQVGAWS